MCSDGHSEHVSPHSVNGMYCVCDDGSLQKRVAQADAHVESTTPMLQGMRFTKINHYKLHYLARVAAAQSKEM